MARISVRAYNQEVEGLIDNHQFEQAVAHCQYILRYYPKHIDTYRLLGKTFLENQQYGDAADIFQRVLSSIPDDFVSHVGMSIIREDEGNLDEAIWHMERAFDVQPANSAIQRELSRLYGRRDGLEPPKVRLTRSALARMYIKGELYPQAINEIRAALKTNPHSYDLLVLLAQAHFRAGQRYEAAEVCSKLLKDLPHCLEANYILGEVLANSERAGEAKTFLLRAQALDPYLAHLTPNTSSSDKVPDSAVVIEKMIWTPGKAPQQPTWATSLGVDLNETGLKEETLPDWLADAKVSPTQEEAETPFSVSPSEADRLREIPAQPLPEGKLPEWMQEAGWTEGSEEGDEIGGFSSGDEIDQQEEALAAEDMPDWLQAIAPEEDLPEPDFLEEQSDVDDAVSPGPNPTGSLPWIEETPSSDSDSVAVWLQDKEVPLTGELKADQIGEPVELPEWLQGMEDEASQPSFGIGAEEASLGEKQPEAHQELDARESELPESPVVGAVEPPALDGEDALAWLENLAEKQGISDGLLLSPEDRREDLPDWAQEIPDEIGEGEPIIPASEVSPAVQAEQGGLPDWLGGSEEFNQGGIPTVSEQKHEGEAEPAEELPEWLSVPEEQRVIEPEEVSSTVVEQVTDGSLTPEEEAAFAWLEGLAEKQGAEEALLSRPEDRPEETPQWVQEAVSQADEHSVDQDGGVISPEAEIIAPESEAEEISTASMTDEWLLEDEVDEALGERLQESAPIHGEVSESEERDLPVETSEIADMEVADLPAWLRESDMEQPEMQVQPSEEADSRLPDWLQPDYEESISESSQTEDLPAWLKQTQTVSEPEQIEEPDEVETAQAIESKPAEEMFEFDMLFSPVEIQEPAITGETEDHLSIEEPAIIEGDTAPVGIHKEGPEPAIEESMLVDEGEGIPDWLEGLEVEEAVSDQAILDEKLPGEPALEATDEETAYAWLEGLAAKQGADEALLLQPEERIEEPPDWVIQASEEAEITASVPQSGEAPVAEEAMSEEIEYEEQRLAEYSELPMVDEADILTPAAETTLSFEEEITEAIETDTFEQLQGEKSVPELPDWLEGLDQEAELREETTWQPPEVTPIQELPTQAEELATEKPLVNVNEAGLVQLEQLPGIGFIKAQAILEFREQHGDFKNLDDLLNVPGLGPGIVNEIRNMITIGAHPEPEALESLSEHQITLMQARNAFVSGELEHTVALYQKLIKAEQMLPEVINDLNEALYRFPVDISIWEALGDAYFRADKLQSALDAYTKAEELLR